MKLSNTMIMTNAVLPSNKKAFTLAEVLITLSILGVVAALTIPSLVNRQSEMAAIVKMKKAISQYEQVVEVYMAENEATDFSGAATSCDTLKNYFKMVESTTDANAGCVFKTADGVVWGINTTGNAVVYDSVKSPRFGVVMWARNGLVNSEQTNLTGTGKPAALVTAVPTATTSPQISAAPAKGYYNAASMLKINKTTDVPTDAPTSINATLCPTAS